MPVPGIETQAGWQLWDRRGNGFTHAALEMAGLPRKHASANLATMPSHVFDEHTMRHIVLVCCKTLCWLCSFVFTLSFGHFDNYDGLNES